MANRDAVPISRSSKILPKGEEKDPLFRHPKFSITSCLLLGFHFLGLVLKEFIWGLC